MLVPVHLPVLASENSCPPAVPMYSGEPTAGDVTSRSASSRNTSAFVFSSSGAVDPSTLTIRSCEAPAEGLTEEQVELLIAWAADPSG